MADDKNDPWWVYMVYLSTLAPWAVMQVFDAIDGKRRRLREVPVRLRVSFVLVAASTGVGLWYVAWADGKARTESATMLLGVALNGWHWIRNSRGWVSYGVLRSQRKRVCELIRRLMALRVQGMASNGWDAEQGLTAPTHQEWSSVWGRMWVNDTVIDNDPRRPPLSLMAGSGHSVSITAGDVLWRMFWLQGAVGKPCKDDGASVAGESRLAAVFDTNPPPCHGEKNLLFEEALDKAIREEIGDRTKSLSVPHLREKLDGLSKVDQERLRQRADEDSAEVRESLEPHTKEMRRSSLEQYDGGQQDIGGLPPMSDSLPGTLPSLWCAMSWVTSNAPSPMENIWYESSALVDALQTHSIPGGREEDVESQWPRFPIVAEWNYIAADLAQQRDVPLLLSVREATNYALRLASVSALLAYHYHAYMELCAEVHRLGIMAHWTHGWSGLVSCYSKYWTRGNVALALLGGLPLLVLTVDGSGNASVKCLLVGLASEKIMSTYLSDARRAARTKELGLRYKNNRGKTCRGSGMRCIRDAMEALNLPQSASQLDGVVAFSCGWAMEAVQGLPGRQAPRDGNDHAQIESLYGSSRAYRFPDERL